MKIVLERSIAVGDTWVAALVGQTVRHHAATAHRLAVSADKRPMAVLIGRGEQLAAFTPAGEPLAATQLERWCPGAAAAFMRDRTVSKASGAAGSPPESD